MMNLSASGPVEVTPRVAPRDSFASDLGSTGGLRSVGTRFTIAEGGGWVSVPELQLTKHEFLQHSLNQRESGGPIEQTQTYPNRLRNTRSCEILHSSMEEPLAPYKKLESLRPQWLKSQRRFHLTHGYRVFDNDTIVVSARDRLKKTPKGLSRSSSGMVTYSATHRTKLELDIAELCRITAHEGIPGGGHFWTPKKLETVFFERTGRPGVWKHYEIDFKHFLSLFPKTFEMMGNCEYLRMRRNMNAMVQEHPEEVIARLARARHHGYIDLPATSKKLEPGTETEKVVLPELQKHRFRAAFAPHDS